MDPNDMLGLSIAQQNFVTAFERFLESYTTDPAVVEEDQQAAEEFELVLGIGKQITSLPPGGLLPLIAKPHGRLEFPVVVQRAAQAVAHLDVAEVEPPVGMALGRAVGAKYDVQIRLADTQARAAADDPCCGWCRVNGKLVCCLSC